MKAIDTSVPGLHICEGLPQIARVADRLTVVRSMTHEYPIHCCAYVMTGMPTYSIPLETMPRAPEQWPFMGSVVDYLDARRTGERSPSLPRNVGLPWRFCSHGSSPDQAGPYGSFLGSGYDPFWTDFAGTGTVVVPKLADGQAEQVRDPHAGIEAASRFQLSPGCQLPQELSAQRFDARVHLLQQFDASRPLIDRAAELGNYESHQQRAMSLVGSNRIRDALDVVEIMRVVSENAMQAPDQSEAACRGGNRRQCNDGRIGTLARHTHAGRARARIADDGREFEGFRN